MYRVPAIWQPYAQLKNGSHKPENEHWRGFGGIGIQNRSGQKTAGVKYFHTNVW